MNTSKYPWWLSEVVYQIYPRSFQDSNGDGIGDLPGIISRLDYLKDLGVTMLWLSPCFLSPMADNGYDISDYRAIAPEFGSMEDMDRLIAEAGKRSIKIMLDLVVNHSSDEHIWFQRALKDPEGPWGDYYIFRKTDRPLANWRSIFGGNVWEKAGDYYYYHTFHRKQPDLNWDNEKLREEVISIVRWWLDKGVSGFRVDAITFLKKEDFSRNYPPDGADGLANVGAFGQDVEGIGGYLTELKREAFDYKPCLTVAEAFGVKDENVAHYVGEDGYFDIIFDFKAADLDYAGEWYHRTSWTVKDWEDKIMHDQLRTQNYGWCANFIENHDQPRAASKYLKEYADRPEAVKTLGAMYFFLRGVPFIYQGQELGMVNFKRDHIGQFDDLSSIDVFQRGLAEGRSAEEMTGVLNLRSRDHGRTPYPWDKSRYGGFSDHKPWLEMTEEYPAINLKDQIQDPDSIYSFYKELICFRQKGKWKDCLRYGSIERYTSDNAGDSRGAGMDQVISYVRKYGDVKLYCWFNFSNRPVTVRLPCDVAAENEAELAEISWHTQDKVDIAGDVLCLRPWQSVVLRAGI
ncbi:MAG: alpha-glucosidase [Eubacterium sp.]|nr:alpha-glucosidase [Eubacterium sp.]